MHLSFVTLALSWNALRSNSRAGIAWAALALGALFLTHLLYSYMMALTLGVLVVVGATSIRDSLRRALRLVVIALPAALISAWMWLPYLTQSSYFFMSPFLQTEKYASYGAPAILGWLVTGDLLDHGRLPVLTALLAIGIVAAVMTRTLLARSVLVLFVVWLVLYFGKPTLGGLVALLPNYENLLLHRFIGGVELFAVVLIGIGGGWLVERLRADASPMRFALACVALLLLLTPAMAERASFYSWNTTWMRQTRDAINADADATTILRALQAQPPGRVFSGLRNSGWGPALNFGIPFNSVRFNDWLVFNRVPVVASPYGSFSLNSDLAWDFTVDRATDFDIMDARYVVAPTATKVPAFLEPLTRTPRYTLYRAPSTGASTFGALIDRELIRKQSVLFASSRAWFNSSDAAAKRFHRFDFPAQTTGASAGAAEGCAQPSYLYERIESARIDLVAACANPSTLVIKVSYHPNWHVSVDGLEVPSFMTSPSYLGVAFPPGKHVVTAEYRSSPMKMPLFLIGVATLASIGFAARPRGIALSPGAVVRRARAAAGRVRASLREAFVAHRDEFVRATVIAVTLRLTLGVLGWASVVIHPRDWASVPMNAPWLAPMLVSQSSPLWPLVGPWQRFDALYYEFVAAKGYGHGPEAAFLPLYPAIEHAIGAVIGSYSLAGLLVSTAAFIVALVAVQALVTRDFGADVARRTVLYLSVFPTAFFFLAGYAEGLFLTLSVGSLLAARSGRLVLAGALVAGAILTRNQGLLLLAPLCVEVAIRVAKDRRLMLPAIVSLVLPVATYGLYYAWLRNLGFAGGPFEVQQVFWRSSFGHPFETLAQSVRVITTYLGSVPYEVLNLAAVVALAASIPAMLKLRFPLSYTAYAAVSLLAMVWRQSAFTPLMSADRFLIVVFPFFVVLALAGRHLQIIRPVVALSLVMLIALFFRYTQFEFVG
jgi:hypothetical protein